MTKFYNTTHAVITEREIDATIDETLSALNEIKLPTPAKLGAIGTREDVRAFVQINSLIRHAKGEV